MKIDTFKVALLSLLLVLNFSVGVVHSQVSSYNFTKSISTYTEITGGTVLASGSAIDNNNYAITGLPFNFYFNGTLYNSFNINSNGFITFGSTLPPADLTNPISSNTNYAGAISAWGRDINGMSNIAGLTSELRWEVIGTAPSRQIVVQWKNIRPNQSNSTTAVPYINFQIRLKETTSSITDITIVYGANGTAAGTVNTSQTVQIGLRGSANSDFKNLTNPITSTFQDGVLGTSNSAIQNFSTVNTAPGMPPTGLQYLFSTAQVIVSAPAIVCQPQSAPTVVTLSGIPNSSVQYQLNGTNQSLILDGSGNATINLGNINNNQSILITSMNSQDGLTVFPQNIQKNIVSSGYCSTNNTSLTDFMLVQNVTTVGNNPTNKTIQIQFDLSWGYSWRDNINWDAAWVFAKYKGSDGLWRHAKLNTAGYSIASSKIVNVTSDKLGAFIYSGFNGDGRFEAPETQLQWNYGLDGLTSVTGLEVRVFAVEMVYIPTGDFNVAKRFAIEFADNDFNTVAEFKAPGNNFPVINSRLSPTLSYNQNSGPLSTLRVKGDAGIDFNNDGVIDNTSYPTGYRAFYCYKYELTEQQYSDFLNCLSAAQQNSLGIAGTNINLSNGEYFSSSPNRACGNMTNQQMLAYADWSGLRPMTLLEINKASYGPLQPILWEDDLYGVVGYYENQWDYGFELKDAGFNDTATSSRSESGSSYYGVDDLVGNATEHVVSMNYSSFNSNNGDGSINEFGNANVIGWSNSGMLITYDQYEFYGDIQSIRGIRLVRSVE